MSELASKLDSKRRSDIYSSSSSPQPASKHSPDARAEQMAAKACHWVRRNPAKWEQLRAFCARLAEAGEPIQRGNVYELARRYGMDVRLASEFRRDHNLWSVLARLMVMDRPSLLSVIAFRETPIDRVDLAGYWRDIVGGRPLAAASLAEARMVWAAERGAA